MLPRQEAKGLAASSPAADGADSNPFAVHWKLASAHAAKSRAWWVEKAKRELELDEYGGGGDACTVDDYQVPSRHATPFEPYPRLVLGAIGSFLEPFHGHLPPRVVKIFQKWPKVIKIFKD